VLAAESLGCFLCICYMYVCVCVCVFPILGGARVATEPLGCFCTSITLVNISKAKPREREREQGGRECERELMHHHHSQHYFTPKLNTKSNILNHPSLSTYFTTKIRRWKREWVSSSVYVTSSLSLSLSLSVTPSSPTCACIRLHPSPHMTCMYPPPHHHPRIHASTTCVFTYEEDAVITHTCTHTHTHTMLAYAKLRTHRNST
jgi:hypothetical protein